MSLFNPKTEETNLIRHLVKTQFFQKNNKSPVVPTSLFESIEQVKEIQINNYPISTVCFDRTGHLLFTVRKLLSLKFQLKFIYILSLKRALMMG